MPLVDEKGQKMMAAMMERYGAKKGKHAGENSGKGKKKNLLGSALKKKK